MNSNVGVSFAEAAAGGLEELGALDGVEADTVASDGESGAGEDNQPDMGNDTDAGVFSSLQEEDEDAVGTAPDGSALIEVPGVGQVSVEDLVAGYMKAADYTQKTQLIAEERKENETAKRLLDALEQDPYNTIRQLAQAQGLDVGALGQRNQAWTRVDELAGKDRNGRDFSNEELDTITIQTQVKEALKEALQNDPDLAAARQQAVRVKVDAHFAALEKAHAVELTAEDRQLILETARQLNSTDLEYVYFKLNQEMETKQVRRKQLVDSGSQSGIRTSGEADTVDNEEIGNFGDALAAAMRELSLEDLTN